MRAKGEGRMEQGGVILSGLLRTAAWLAVFCVIVFDTGSVLINRVLLDEAARVAAGAAAESWREHGDRQSAAAAVADSVEDQEGVEVVDVEITAEQAQVTAHRRARVLLADRIPPLRSMVEAQVTAHASLRVHDPRS